MKEKALTQFVCITFFIFGLLPDSLAILLGRFIGWVLQYVLRFKKDIILGNLQIVYGEKENWPENIVKRIYRHFGLLLIEILRLPSLKGEKFTKRFHFHGFENIDAVLEQGKGAIVISGHLGNWEYGIGGLVSEGYKTSVVVKKLKGINNDVIFQKMRGDKNVVSILKDKAILNLRRALKRNELVTLVVDQNSKRTEGVFVEHFGKLASTYASPRILSKKFKCPVIPIYSYRDDNLRDFHVVAYPEIKTENLSENDTEENTRLYIKTFEDFLMKHPEQWIWMHKRWRTQPRK